MLISFYHISLCPRCAQTRKHLRTLLGSRYDETVQEINVLQHPALAVKNKIAMVPALVVGDDRLSGIFLSLQAITTFLKTHDITIETP